jgi:hypothetical protein
MANQFIKPEEMVSELIATFEEISKEQGIDVDAAWESLAKALDERDRAWQAIIDQRLGIV